MIITIKYHFNGKDNYDYDCIVKLEDLLDYLLPEDLAKKLGEENAKAYRKGLAKMYSFLNENKAIDSDLLEHDEYFVDFLKERYKKEAYKEFCYLCD